MDALDETFKTACEDGTIPGVVLAAANRSGSLQYVKAFGYQSLQEGDKKPCTEETMLTLFSATKLITTIAALQLVEKGILTLDEDVTAHLPALAELQVLVEMKDGKEPVLEKREGPITLRSVRLKKKTVSKPPRALPAVPSAHIHETPGNSSPTRPA